MTTVDGRTSAPPPHSFNPDQPIRTRAEDRLGIDPFVRRLVRPLLHAPSDSSLVVGLYGEWGHGKTSALNLLEIALQEVAQQESHDSPPEPRPIVVRFTPWLYSSVETLLPAFFETLAASVGGVEAIDETKRKRWRAALKGMGEFVAPAIRLGALVIAGPAGSTAVDAVAGAIQGAAKGAAEGLAGGEASFREQKEKAAEVLRSFAEYGAPLRLIILVDDLDRAAGAEEVFAMLKLVKLVADLPNVSYVLAMDRARVQEVLQRNVSKTYGADFLDKIVQIPITLPPLHSERLSRLLIDEATDVATAAGLDASVLRVEWDKWEILRRDAYESRLRPALRTLRDVARVVNTFRFAALTGTEPPEVHAVDLLLLSTLQALYPAVYDGVRKNRRFLLHEDHGWYSSPLNGQEQEVHERRRARLQEIASAGGSVESVAQQGAPGSSSARSQELDIPALRILEYLFPHAAGTRLEGLDSQLARNDARIHSPERFNWYFRLQPPEDEVPQRDALALYGVLLEIGVDECSREENAGDGRVSEVVDRLRALTGGTRESILRQLDDRAAAMTLEEARGMSVALPPLARVGADVAGDAIQGLAAHVFRTLSNYRADEEDSRSTNIELGVKMLLDLIEALPAFPAAEYASDLTRSEGLAYSFDEDTRRTLAAAGLRRSEELFDSAPNIFGELGPRAGRHAVWSQNYLARRADITPDEATYPPLQTYLERLLDEDPSTLSDIIALAASWGTEPGFRMRTRGEVLASLGNLLDVSLVEARAHQMVARGAPTGTWPSLVLEFVQLFDQVTSEAPTPRPDAPPDDRASNDGDIGAGVMDGEAGLT